MRLGVLDVGSHCAHLRVVQARPGGSPQPVFQLKVPLHLSDAVGADGAISTRGVERLAAAVATTAEAARRHEVAELIPYATAVVRDAPARAEICDRVRRASGIQLSFLSGTDDARLTFLAAHRWLGWSAGPLLLIDIGGGTTELAHGREETPAYAVSVPLGVRPLTDRFLPEHPAGSRAVEALRAHVRVHLAELLDLHGWNTDPPPAAHAHHAVGTSKTLKQLAKLTAGSTESDTPRNGDTQRNGPAERNGPAGRLCRADLDRWIPRLAELSPAQRARLRGISAARARHILAGAIIAEATMAVLELEHLDICPWALREGVLLARLAPPPDPTRTSPAVSARVPFSVIPLGGHR